jgi:predicted TIM-barrel fold metal-dependent hydrolase
MTHDGYKVLDSDLHVFEPADLWLRYIEPRYRDQAPVGSEEYFPDMLVKHEGKYITRTGHAPLLEGGGLSADLINLQGQMEKYKAIAARGWGPDTQLEAMDEEGVDVAVLFPTRGFYAIGKEYADDKLASAVARAYNDWLAEFCARAPKRLYGAALLAVQSIDLAVEEVRRAKCDLGFKAVYLRPNPVRRRNWHDPAYDALWAECEKHQLTVGFHEGWPCALPVAIGDRFDGRHEDLWLTEHVACHPVEAMYASLCLIAGGVLERFPGLKVAFLEANCSWVPFWLWRLDEHYEHRERAVKDRMPLRPSEYFKRQCFASIEAEEALGKYVLDWMGDDNLVFSTDYPHEDSRFPKAVSTFLEQPFPEKSKRKILWDNCARLYNLA